MFSRSSVIKHKRMFQYNTIDQIDLVAVDGTQFVDPQLSGLSNGNLSSDNELMQQLGIDLQSFGKAGNNTNVAALVEKYYSE